jgi:hypothetical protein
MADEDEELDPEELELTHTGLWVVRADHVIVPAIVDSFADEKRRHALVFHWLGDDWAQQTLDDFVCNVCGIDGKPVQAVSVGVNGNGYVALVPGEKFVETVDTSERGPNYSETLRCTRVIAGKVYAAGMARQVYRREKRGSWTAIDDGVYVPRGKRKAGVGFLDIDGLSPKSIYAVGYKGEIWHYDGQWHQEDSPTNIALTRAVPLESGEMVVVGLGGTILRGRTGSWRQVEQDTTEDDFWGGMEFKGKLYLSTSDGIFTLAGDKLKSVKIGGRGSKTTMFLHAADGVLWSVGAKDIFRSNDGATWERVPSP